MTYFMLINTSQNIKALNVSQNSNNLTLEQTITKNKAYTVPLKRMPSKHVTFRQVNAWKIDLVKQMTN